MTKLPRIIAMAGPARVGKDTLAAYFTGHKRLAFADELKDAVGSIFHVNRRYVDDHKDMFREALVAVGQLGRAIKPDHWSSRVEDLIEDYPDKQFVITDCRYKSEADMIHRFGGVVIYVRRNGYEPVNDEERSSLPAVEAVADFNVLNIEGEADRVAAQLKHALEGGDPCI